MAVLAAAKNIQQSRKKKKKEHKQTGNLRWINKCVKKIHRQEQNRSAKLYTPDSPGWTRRSFPSLSVGRRRWDGNFGYTCCLPPSNWTTPAPTGSSSDHIGMGGPPHSPLCAGGLFGSVLPLSLQPVLPPPLLCGGWMMREFIFKRLFSLKIM